MAERIPGLGQDLISARCYFSIFSFLGASSRRTPPPPPQKKKGGQQGSSKMARLLFAYPSAHSFGPRQHKPTWRLAVADKINVNKKCKKVFSELKKQNWGDMMTVF